MHDVVVDTLQDVAEPPLVLATEPTLRLSQLKFRLH